MVIPAPGAAEHVIDPVCGMQILTTDAVGRQEHRGRTYYFCSPACQETFAANPEAFIGAAPPVPAGLPPAGADTREYTCPMHPEVRQVGPGSLSEVRHGARADVRSAGDPHGLDLPDASRDRAGCTWRVPHLRDGARAADGHAGGPQSRTGGHDATVQLVARADGAHPGRDARRRDPRATADAGDSTRRADVGPVGARHARWCCGAAGRSSSAAGPRWSTGT